MIVVNQVKNIYTAFFTGVCERCRGTGIMTCPHVSRPCAQAQLLLERAGLPGLLAGPCHAPLLPWSAASRCIPSLLLPGPQCHGTKTLRQRPGLLRTRDFGVVANPRDAYLCFYCGPPSQVRPAAGASPACHTMRRRGTASSVASTGGG